MANNQPNPYGCFFAFIAIFAAFVAVALILNKCQGTDGIRSTKTNTQTGSVFEFTVRAS